MGGFGSGGSHYRGRPTVEESCVLRLAWLRRQGALARGYASGSSSWSVRGEIVATIGWRTDISGSPNLTLSYIFTPRDGSPERRRGSLSARSDATAFW
jgi:hypothetical protein